MIAPLARLLLRGALIALPVLLIAGGWWLLDSQAGMRFALARADRALGGGLSVTHAAGRLAGPLDLEGVTLVHQGTRVEIATLHLDLHPAPLLLGRLQLITFIARGVRVHTTPDPDQPPRVLPDRIDLPFHIALEHFTIEDLVIGVGARAPLQFDRVSGAASADARGLRLDELEVGTAGGGLRGHLALGLAQPYPVDGLLTLDLSRPARPSIVSATLGGRLEALEISATSPAPLAASAELTLRDPLNSPQLAGTASCTALQPAALDPALAALTGATLDCSLKLEATGAATRVSGRLRYRQPGLAPANLDLTLHASPHDVVIDQGALAFDDAPLRVSARGRIALDRAAHPFAFTLSATDLAAPTPRPGPVLAERATLTLDGDLDAARATLDASQGARGTLRASATLAPRTRHYTLDAKFADWGMPLARLVEARLAATGDGTGSDLEFDGTLRHGAIAARARGHGRLTANALVLVPLELATLDGHIEGSARLDLGDALRWQAELTARDLDPRLLDARFPGRIGARVAIAGAPAATRITLAGLGGTLRDRALSGHARFRVGAGLGPGFAPAIAFDEQELTSGAARASAAFDARTGRFALEAPDLADLLPEARGRLSAKLTLDRAAVGALDLEGAGLVIGGLRLAQVSGRVLAPATGPLAATLTLRDLATGDLVVDAANFGADGPRDALHLTLDARRGAATLSAEASGTFTAHGFSGTLARVGVVPESGPRWELTAPSALRIGADGAHLEGACLSDGHARGCLSGGWHPLEPWRVHGRVEHLALAVFGGVLARGLDYQGELDLELDAAGHGPLLGATRAALTLSAGQVLQPARRERAATRLLEWSGGQVEIIRDAERLVGRLALDLGGHGSIDANATATGSGGFGSRELSGRLRASADQFALLPVLVPELKRLDGRFDSDLKLSGTVDLPHFAGRIAFSDGVANLPRYGLALDAVNLQLVGDGDALTVTGSARSGGTVQWRADLKRQDGQWHANGRLWGEKFVALDLPEARIVASPSLLLQLDGRDLKLDGEVVVPRARIAPRSLASAVQTSADEVIVDQRSAANDDGLRVAARLRLKLGDDVKFEGFGLKARIAGEIALDQQPDALTLGSGVLTLADGQYETYGQKLTIERGRLLFSGGPAGNPGIDVHATRAVERFGADQNVVVGIDVRGTLREPRTTVFATPAMSSSDALAYLVLGRPLSESTDSDQQKLNDAATKMRLSGGEFIAHQIGRRIGLDEVRISDAEDPAQAQLWLGTYLSPRLFVSYGMGVFEQFHTARVRYQVSTRWSVEAESGRESSADVKYTIER